MDEQNYGSASKSSKSLTNANRPCGQTQPTVCNWLTEQQRQPQESILGRPNDIGSIKKCSGFFRN